MGGERMVTIETAAALVLSGYIVGDMLGPVRRATVTALTNMEQAVTEDVQND